MNAPQDLLLAKGNSRRLDFSADVERAMEAEAECFLATVPHAAHLTSSDEPLNEHYYLRHRIETVHRIRMTARTDALALAKMVQEDYVASRHWAVYTAEELGHDALFMADLRKHGLVEETVLATPPLSSTVKMVKYLEDQITVLGSLPAVCYSLFVEWNSERYSPKAVKRAATHFSPAHVAGARGHIGVDEELDHYRMMEDLVFRLPSTRTSWEPALDSIRRIAQHFRDYFTELYNVTVTEVHTGSIKS